ncbi:hypothetical protein FB451DRAFT_1177593 [Mycena latifolia]|nr:hypothetical protein FB451DRAFT_1177593 [Mycena latifolia]
MDGGAPRAEARGTDAESENHDHSDWPGIEEGRSWAATCYDAELLIRRRACSRRRKRRGRAVADEAAAMQRVKRALEIRCRAVVVHWRAERWNLHERYLTRERCKNRSGMESKQRFTKRTAEVPPALLIRGPPSPPLDAAIGGGRQKVIMELLFSTSAPPSGTTSRAPRPPCDLACTRVAAGMLDAQPSFAPLNTDSKTRSVGRGYVWIGGLTCMRSALRCTQARRLDGFSLPRSRSRACTRPRQALAHSYSTHALALAFERGFDPHVRYATGWINATRGHPALPLGQYHSRASQGKMDERTELKRSRSDPFRMMRRR